jgi:hypothetical protein
MSYKLHTFKELMEKAKKNEELIEDKDGYFKLLEDLAKEKIPDRFYRDIEKQIYDKIKGYGIAIDRLHTIMIEGLTIGSEMIPFVNYIKQFIRESEILNPLSKKYDVSIVQAIVAGIIHELNGGENGNGTISLNGRIEMIQLLEPTHGEVVETPDKVHVTTVNGQKDDDFDKIIVINNNIQTRIIHTTYRFTLLFANSRF